MSIPINFNDTSYELPEEGETPWDLTEFLTDVALYLTNGYLANSGAKIKFYDVVTSGTLNDLSTVNKSILNLTSCDKVSGFANPSQGKFLTVFNTNSNPIEISNDDVLSIANNRILTGSSSSFYLYPNKFITFYYDTSVSRWRLMSENGKPELTVNVDSGVINDLDVTLDEIIKFTLADKLTGFLNPGKAKFLTVFNTNSSPIEITNQDVLSLESNRIITSDSESFFLYPNKFITLFYDTSVSRWRVITSEKDMSVAVDGTVGEVTDLDVTHDSIISFTDATEVTGFTQNKSKSLIVINSTGTSLTVKNLSDSLADNQIITGTGGDIILDDNQSISLVYDDDSSKWRVIGSNISLTLLNTKEDKSQKGIPGGYASLDVGGKVPVSEIDLSFFDLNDVTPDVFTGNKTKVVRVNNAETGLELGFANNTTDNYIQFPTAIYSDPLTLGWEMYNDGVTPPVDGVGGTPTISFASQGEILPNTNYPDYNNSGLVPTDWYQLAFNPAPGGIHQGVSYPFTINAQHRASILEISFDYYLRNDGTVGFTFPSDIRCYIINEDTGEVIESSNLYVTSTPTNFISSTRWANPAKYFGTFQTGATSKNYRLCIHLASDSYRPFFFKNVRVWSPEKTYGAVITEWQSYTSTLTNLGTSPTQNLWWRRNGSSLEIRGRITPGTSVPGALGNFSTPNGYVFNSSILATRQAVGIAVRGTGSENQCNLLALGGESVFYFSQGESSSALTPKNTNTVFNDSEELSVRLSVPIQGWGGTVQLSSQVGDGRTVLGTYSGHTSVSLTADVTTYKLNTLVKDSHSAYNTSTGEITIPIAGDYRFTLAYTVGSSGSSSLFVWKNGVTTGLRFCDITTSSGGGGSIVIPNLKTGDVITFRSGGSVTTATNTATSLTFESINGGSQAFAREEFVGCSYYLSANTTTSNQINFSAKLYDTHNAVTTGASWKFTAPQNGKYLITGFFATTGNYRILLYKNGSTFVYSLGVTPVSSPNICVVSYPIDLLAGDYIDLRPDSSSTWSGGTLGSAYASRIEITKVS